MAITRTITFKPGHDAEAERCLDVLYALKAKSAPGDGPHILSENVVAGQKTIKVSFPDELDYSALLSVMGTGDVEIKVELGEDRK